MEPTSTYEEQAQRVAQAIGLTVKAAFKGDKCPQWEKPCKHQHGDRYRITLRKAGRSISFDWWNSINDIQKGTRPDYYDILSSVSSDAFSPTDPDEVVAEFGEMKPSRAVTIAKFAAKLQAFFTEDELTALGEIR
mgnify:CR=1 FL=1